MTIEEKAKEESPYIENTWQEGYNLWESGFSKGVEWMFKKAMSLIEDSVIFDKFGRPVKPETLRKAMEE